ncbi:fatty acyl-CoA reductase wat-like [Cataglyphis hispanica]|uniref:fatty acyl-CoA reductase wat-like n=1 Tax=Cataglyphis hispanica TaxID=1086592 RepID=UPI00217F72CF|nr:fatty acyl-CoA reductase wat-like [Cataglyphis hispanica]XP_050463961.1 fatty acyl-CoA reductase wat-like [Cataglyphis hispanica]
MVEVLLDRIDGQEVAIVDSNCIPGSPTKCSPRTENSSAINEKLSPIQEFYYGQSIFLTGGTGFMGKLLIEKLLRTCSGVASIYLLVRPKKGKDVHQRTEEIFDDPLFTKLRDEQPKFRHQIVAIAGDCSQPNLGMSSQDRATIIREVSIVFHVAATLRFDEKLKLAVPVNVRSTRDVLNLCKEISNLKSFVHVSTAYANCPQKVIEEKFYDSPMDSDKLIALMECVEDKLAEDITPQLLGKWPNTYTYTKAVGENVIRKQAGDLPVGIFRPAIVISTYKEPLRGWIDNLYGPTGVAAGAGTGLLRSIHCNGSVHANVVPADLTVNALIACAWDIANIRRSNNKSHSDIPIYNYVSKDNPITYDELKILSSKYGLETPSTKAIWYYSFRNNKHRIVHLFFVYFCHLLPALLVDTVTVCTGRQPRLLKVYKKIHKFMDVLNYFSTQEWKFTNDRLHALLIKLTPKDRENFFCDIRDLDWNVYFETYISGIRIYLIKDPLDTLPQARLKWQKLYWSHQVLKLILTYVALKLSWMVISILFNFFKM